MDKTITEKTGGRSARRLRSGGRSANTARRKTELFKQSHWRLPVNHDPPIEPLSKEGVQAIHNGAMDILEILGSNFLTRSRGQFLHRLGAGLMVQTSKWTVNG